MIFRAPEGANFRSSVLPSPRALGKAPEALLPCANFLR